VTDEQRLAQANLRWPSSAEALLRAHQRDADELKRFGRHSDANVRHLEAEIADAQHEMARLTRAATDNFNRREAV
jgi:hypothetical protein